MRMHDHAILRLPASAVGSSASACVSARPGSPSESLADAHHSTAQAAASDSENDPPIPARHAHEASQMRHLAQRGPDGAAARRRAGASAASSLVLLHYAGRDAPAFTDGQAVLLGPGADITRVLPVRWSPPGPAGRCPPRPAGVLKVGRELRAE